MSIPLEENQLRYLNALHPYHPDICYVPVQQQNEATSCGVFAIAFAVATYFRDNPSGLKFDCTKMREHIWHTIRHNRLKEIFLNKNQQLDNNSQPRNLNNALQ